MSLLPGPNDNNQEVNSLSSLQQKITPETRVYLLEGYEICEKYQIGCSNKIVLEGRARSSLNGLTLKKLINLYPEDAGWKISWDKQEVIISRLQQGMCPEHQQRWHLEVDETGEKVAIYIGPPQVGKEGGLVRVTNIEITNLPKELQERIVDGVIEFLTWEELIGTLDSLAEYMKD